MHDIIWLQNCIDQSQRLSKGFTLNAKISFDVNTQVYTNTDDTMELAMYNIPPYMYVHGMDQCSYFHKL